jgi:hypothetical protein
VLPTFAIGFSSGPDDQRLRPSRADCDERPLCRSGDADQISGRIAEMRDGDIPTRIALRS